MILKNHQSMLYLISVVLCNVTTVLVETPVITGSWETVEIIFYGSLWNVQFSAISITRVAVQCSITPMKDGLQKALNISAGSCEAKIGEGGYMKLTIKNASPSCPLRIVSLF